MSSDIHALSGAYAVDALDGQERDAFERHLADCPACQAEVDSLREAAAFLAEDVATAPPEHLRARVLDNIATVRPLPPVVPFGHRLPKRRVWLSGSLIAAAAIALFAVWALPHTAPPTSTISAAQVVHASDVVMGRGVAADQTLLDGASVTFYRSAILNHAAISTTDLPALAAGKTYELWIESPDKKMHGAGFLHGGTNLVLLKGQAASAIGAGITVEPQGGSATPTLPAVTIAEFPRV